MTPTTTGTTSTTRATNRSVSTPVSNEGAHTGTNAAAPTGTNPGTSDRPVPGSSGDGERIRRVHRAARPLRGLLVGNAAFSFASGAFAVAAADRVADWSGADVAGLVRLIGIGLILYVPLLVLAARSAAPTLAAWSLPVSIADFAWVAATVGLLATGAVDAGGAWLLAGAGLVVLALGTEQLLARHRLLTALA